MRVIVGSRVFERPEAVFRAATADDARAALRLCDEALDRGQYVAGYLAYELGAALAGLPYKLPKCGLLALGMYSGVTNCDERALGDFSAGPLLARMPFGGSPGTPDAYRTAIGQIHDLIREGDVYQVNYTLPFDFAFRGDPLAYYDRLVRASEARHCAYVEDCDLVIASISPESFLELDGERVWARPMKGTAALALEHELHGEKNRAEHVMIVDLLRNDLHRICSDVRVDQLFEVERYPTFATMTSTISGALRPGLSLLETLEATFPCGSVTGAPKRAAMEAIARLERWPRGAYTGSIGYLTPARSGAWNVAIRTAQIDLGRNLGRMDFGGGIVADSDPGGEWSEMRLKARFAAAALSPFDLLETFRSGGDLDAHLQRLDRSAQIFNIPMDGRLVRDAVAHRVAESGGALLRLRVGNDGSARIQAEPYAPQAGPVRVWMSRERVFSGDPMLAHKTSWRDVYETAYAEAREHGCFEGILQNERGEITEGSRTNVFVKHGDWLVTPPLGCGVLPGILRSELIARGAAIDGVLYERDLREGDVYIGNSARGLLRVDRVLSG